MKMLRIASGLVLLALLACFLVAHQQLIRANVTARDSIVRTTFSQVRCCLTGGRTLLGASCAHGTTVLGEGGSISE